MIKAKRKIHLVETGINEVVNIERLGLREDC